MKKKHKLTPLEEYAIFGSELTCMGIFIISFFKATFDLFFLRFDTLTLSLIPLSIIFYSIISLLNFFRLNWDREYIDDEQRS